MTNYASMFNVWTATNFARDWIIEIADCIDSEFLWIFIPELTMRL